MAKKILTQQDIELNPELVEQDLKVGDEIEIPDGEVTSSETNADETNDPPGVEVPKRPPPPEP